LSRLVNSDSNDGFVFLLTLPFFTWRFRYPCAYSR